MTENDFFDAQADEPAQSRKSLLVLGAVGGAVALAAGGYFLLGGGGGGATDNSYALPVHRSAPVVKVGKVGKTVATKPVVLPAASKVRLGRDPFLALYVPPVASTGVGGAPAGATPAAPAAAAPGTPAAVPVAPAAPTPAKPASTGTTGSGTTGSGTTGSGTTGSGTGGAPPAAAPVKHRFTIFGISGSAGTGRARVSIDGGAPFTVHEGSVFGPSKELTITDIGLTVGVGEHVAFTLGEDPQPEMYAHESRLVP